MRSSQMRFASFPILLLSRVPSALLLAHSLEHQDGGDQEEDAGDEGGEGQRLRQG